MSNKPKIMLPPEFDGTEGDDPLPGCSCGHNCDRIAGDPCPLYELGQLAKFKGVTATDVADAAIIPDEYCHSIDDAILCLWRDKGFGVTWYLLQLIAAIKERENPNVPA